jgi:hypothetical protein
MPLSPEKATGYPDAKQSSSTYAPECVRELTDKSECLNCIVRKQKQRNNRRRKTDKDR